MVEDLKKEDDE